MFIGRKTELDFLNNCYNSDNAEFVVLYGRRRVGKTETLTEFCKGKPNVFYSCREYTSEKQLKEFSDALLSAKPEVKAYTDSFADWNKAFSFMGELGDVQKEKTVIVIDEFPYMCKNTPSIPSVLQIAWDTILKHKNIMLVICGSSMSFIEKELLSEKNPLYGRITGIYKMLPMPYYDAIKFLPHFSDEDKLTAYAILGGIPHYLKQFDSSKTLKENIITKILTKGTVLYSEVEFLLRQELRETAIYNTIIESIALGSSSFNEILTKTGIEKSKLSVYLKNLIELGIAEREFPVMSGAKEHSGNKGLYNLTDNYFRFWYAFGFSNLSELENDDALGVWEDYIENSLHDFASKSFENVCIEYMYRMNKQRRLPFRFSKIGRWWGTVTRFIDGKKRNCAEEVDIFATDKNEKKFIVGECKFRNSLIDNGEVRKLKEKLSLSGEAYYYLFSLSGFTDAVNDASKSDDHIFLIDAKKITGVEN
ncbi:MAG: ATP-binding protein [Clostridia bacterium]|nr:ATP-binding protein [Clostridia bacterium]